jgi:Putative exonuclease SbcCD, C subunit
MTDTNLNFSGTWQHGLLTGQSHQGTMQFIGKATREHIRQQELNVLLLSITTLQQELESLYHELTQRETHVEKFSSEQEEIRTLLDTVGLPTRLQEVRHIGMALTTSREKLQTIQEHTHKKRQEQQQIVTQLVQCCGISVFFIHDHKQVQAALRETYELGPQTRMFQQGIQTLIQTSQEMQDNLHVLQEIKAEEEEQHKTFITAREQLKRQEALVEGLQELLNTPEAKDLLQKLEILRAKSKELDEEKITLTGIISACAERLQTASSTIVQKEQELQTAQITMRRHQSRFKDLLTMYPVSELQEAQTLTNQGMYKLAVQPLLSPEDSFGQLQKEQIDATGAIIKEIEMHRSLLDEYRPEFDLKTSLVTFSQEKGATPVDLLSTLEDHRQRQQSLLKDEEIKLYESFLLRRMTEVIHKHIREAKEWVEKVNQPLQNMATVRDQYELEWQPVPPPPPSLEKMKLGTFLAKQQKLFIKPPAKLNEGEQEQLRTAFRQEIEAIWQNQEAEESTMNFEQRLQVIFDYRQWFQFRVYVTPKDGQRSLLTNNAVGSRSGAERLFALLVPLLAAVTALYNQASEEAPRLLALDEAFDRADTENMKTFVEYLAKQDFQWIMTGPHLNISGSQVPVSIRYLMLHEKGKKVATAVAKIWKSC